MSSIKSLYSSVSTIPAKKPLIKESISYPYKAAIYANSSVDNKVSSSSVKILYTNLNNNQTTNSINFISYNDDYSIPKKPKVLYPQKKHF